MKIAIIGAGIAGLGAAYHLYKRHEITLFYDTQGASYAATGLLHAFIGDTGEKSFEADLALKKALELIEHMKGDFLTPTPIIRRILNEKMKLGFLKYVGSDLELIDDENVLIHQGYKLEMPKYLAALHAFLAEHGVTFIERKIHHLEELEGFDQIIIAAGFGIKELVPSLKMKFLKGQSLVFENLAKHHNPLIAKGYLVPFSDHVVIGSSYERVFDTPFSDLDAAYKYLEDPLKKYFSPYDQKTPLRGLSGVRVAHPNFNHPKIIPIDQRTFCITGLGSRGLLYHGLIGKKMADVIDEGLHDDPFVFKKTPPHSSSENKS